MAYSSLQDILIETGKPTKREIFTTVKDNQDDHESRIASLEAGASNVVVFDEIIELDRARTGDIKLSMLSTAQYQAKFGTDWVKIDGSSIAGSDLASLYGATLPDARNRFTRITDESSRAIGSTESNQNKSHAHDIDVYNGAGAGGTSVMGGDGTGTRVQLGGQIFLEGGTEARPDSVIFNAFTRKNDYEIEQALLWRAPFAFSLTSSIVTTLVAGSSGTLEVDVKKGSTLGSLTTVFSTKPSVLQAAGNNASSSNAVFSSNSVSLNDWLQLDVTSLQVGQHRFHMYLIGELT